MEYTKDVFAWSSIGYHEFSFYLLSASINLFLIGLGVYLLFLWQRKLDARDVFITYSFSISVCYGVYSLSSLSSSASIDISEPVRYVKSFCVIDFQAETITTVREQVN